MAAIPRESLDRANTLIQRLKMLDDGVGNAYAFRFMLEDLNSRDQTVVVRPHIDAIVIARAGILRAEIGAVMAVLDKKDTRNNRASVGQVLERLKDHELQTILIERRMDAYEELCGAYVGTISSELFNRCSRLRNESVAHILESDTPMPTVEYRDVWELIDIAAGHVEKLFHVCGRPSPRFLALHSELRKNARVFWDTYFRGMVG